MSGGSNRVKTGDPSPVEDSKARDPASNPEHRGLAGELIRGLPLICAAVVGAWSWQFRGAGHDDLWIMLSAGKSLHHGGWFLNPNGLPEETSTSFLGALIAAAVTAVASDENLVAFWKITMWIPGLAAAALVARTTVGVAGAVATMCAVLLLAAVPDWSYWLWGGLENGLFGLVCLLLATASARYVSATSGWRSGAELALATILVALTRADGIWALGITAAACFLQRGSRFRAWPLAVSIFVLSGIHGIRFGFTGLLFPTPTYAKMSISLKTALQGLSYLTDFGSQSLLHGVFTFVLPAVGATVLARALIFVKRPSRFVDLGSAPWAVAVAMSIDASTIAAGGDWMGYYRFATRSLPVKAILLAVILGWLFSLARERWGRWVPFVAGSLLVAGFAGDASAAQGIVVMGQGRSCGPQHTQAILDVDGKPWSAYTHANLPWIRDQRLLLPFIDTHLSTLVDEARAQGRLPLKIASYQAGVFVWEVRRRYAPNTVMFLDIAGVTDSRFGRLPGARTPLGLSEGIYDWAQSISRGSGALGRALSTCRPDVVYVLGCSQVDLQLMSQAGYRLDYARVIQIEGVAHRATVFVTSGAPGCASLEVRTK
jgi:hypothetical protein